MPGVNVRTATRSGPVNAAVPASGGYGVVGMTERGRTDVAQRVRSLAEFQVLYGGRFAAGFLYDDLRTFFEEEGGEAYVVRKVGPAATSGEHTFADTAAQPTLTVTALGEGAASADIEVTVERPGTLAGTFKLIVEDTASGIRETYDNLVTPADAVEALNGSQLVRGTDEGSATAAPGDQPAATAATALSAGADDAAAVTAAQLVDGLDLLDGDQLTSAVGGPTSDPVGVVAIPGYTGATITAGLKAHAKANDRLYYTPAPVGSSVGDAKALAQGLLAPDGEYGGVFYPPRVRIPLETGGTKLVSPEGYLAALRARAHRDVGPWQAPAGERGVAKFVLGPEVALTRAEADDLDDNNVNAIRTIAGTTRLYGYRSLSSDEANYALLIGRDVLNTYVKAAEVRLERYVFRTIDAQGRLFASIAGTLKALVEPMRAAGGLYERRADNGDVLDPGYSIDVGPTVNTDAVLAANEVHAVLAMRVSPVGTLIALTIVKAGLTASV